jgi:hypothetical protein
MPKMRMADMTSVVMTGRRMKISVKFIVPPGVATYRPQP